MRDIPKAVILWGNKDGYRETLPRLRSLCRRGEIRIVGYTQTEEIRKKTVDGFPVVSPGEINGSLCDLILIFDWRSYGAVAAFLLNQPGITRENLLPGWLLRDRDFDMERYRQLLRSRISILSNNCWGGILCYTLGMENRSPLKNCWIGDDEYLKLLRSPEHYLLECDPVFDRWEEGGDEGQERFPVLRLDDIRVHCNHDYDPETAIQNWLRRRAKLDLNNVFAEFSPFCRKNELEFSQLDRYPRKLCLVSWKTEIPVSMRVKRLWKDDHMADTVVHTAKPDRYPQYYSPVELLLTGRHYTGPRVSKTSVLFFKIRDRWREGGIRLLVREMCSFFVRRLCRAVK